MQACTPIVIPEFCLRAGHLCVFALLKLVSLELTAVCVRQHLCFSTSHCFMLVRPRPGPIKNLLPSRTCWMSPPCSVSASDAGLCEVTAIDVRNISFTLSWCMNCLRRRQKKGECSHDVNLILEFFSFPKHFVSSLSSKNKERNEKKMLPKVFFVKIICQNSIWNTGDVWKLRVKGKNRKWIWWSLAH